eukprot:5954779-Alexandrium_andersonii.AAC.1
MRRRTKRAAHGRVDQKRPRAISMTSSLAWTVWAWRRSIRSPLCRSSRPPPLPSACAPPVTPWTPAGPRPTVEEAPALVA